MALANGAINARRDGFQGGVDLLIEFDGDSSYPTGGTADFTAFVNAIIAAAAAAAGDANVRGPETMTVVAVIPQDCGQYVPNFDIANDKLFVRDGGHATWDEVANTTDLHTTKFNVLVVCQ